LARLPRVVVPDQAHLIVQRGRSGGAIFLNDGDRQSYVDALRSSSVEASVTVHAYSLLETEVRLLVTPASRDGLARLMQAIGRRYVTGFNRNHDRNGTPWEGRFRSTVIEASDYFLPVMRYVELPWFEREAGGESVRGSSVGHHLGHLVDPVIAEHPIYWTLGNTPFERELAYRRFLEQPVDDAERARILEAAIFGWPLGSDAFKVAVQDRTGRRAHRKAAGRPMKGKIGAT
jgi:putative transposase